MKTRHKYLIWIIFILLYLYFRYYLWTKQTESDCWWINKSIFIPCVECSKYTGEEAQQCYWDMYFNKQMTDLVDKQTKLKE